MYAPNCERARERMMEEQARTRSKHLPRGSQSYFPRSGIIKVLAEFPVEDIFTCVCERCRYYAELEPGFDRRRKDVDREDLLGSYATTYGLLIYLRFPNLIAMFMRHKISLENGYLSDEQLHFLDGCKAFTTTQAQVFRGELLENQYRFRIRTLKIEKIIKTIDEQEIFPIEEDEAPVSKGDFGEVYAFELPSEYVQDSLKSKRVSCTTLLTYQTKLTTCLTD